MSETIEYYQPEPQAPEKQPSRSGSHFYRGRFWARRYWWIVALCIMIGLGIVDIFCIRDTPEYLSTARMMVSGRVSLPQGEMYSQGLELVNFYGTQVALMKSAQTINQATERVASLHPEVPADPDADVEAVIEPRTSIFDLRVNSTNPDYAKLLLDSVMDTYLNSKREWKNQTTDEAVSAITEEISRLDAEIRNDGQQLLDFQRTNNVVFIEEQSGSAANYLVGLKSELALLTKQRDLLEMFIQSPVALPDVTAGNPGATAAAAASASDIPAPPPKADAEAATAAAAPGAGIEDNSDVIRTEEDRIEKLRILRDQYGVDLKDAHPKMKDLADSIEKEQKFLDVLKTQGKSDREIRLEQLELQIKNLEKQIATWSAESLDLSQRLGTYQELQSKKIREQALYNQLSSQIQNVDLNKTLAQEDVVIMEAASPARQISHNYLLRLLYGVAGGIVVGLLLIFLLVRLDDKINAPLDIEENFDYPLLGEIPLARVDKKSRRVPLVEMDDSRYEFLEHHRDIRSALFFGKSDTARPRSLVITSAAPGEGKSTLAANLAATCAFSGIRVLLIDADLRRGIQHSIFGIPVKPGLSNYLQGEVAWREVTHSTKIPNLDLLPRGKVTGRAGDLLLTAAIDYLIQESLMEYDMVLWDTAPLFAAHDAANLSSRVEGILFMARVRHSSVNLVRAAMNDLVQRNARIVGIVLNAVKPGTPGYYQKYRYKEYSSVA